jgi:hypothetical protein
LDGHISVTRQSFFLTPVANADKQCNQLQGLVFHIFPEAFFVDIGKPIFLPRNAFCGQEKFFDKSFSRILRFA